MTEIPYGTLQRGQTFQSPRESEGLVRVVCPPGECTHDKRDQYSCHVRSSTFGTEFFVVAHPDDLVELAP